MWLLCQDGFKILTQDIGDPNASLVKDLLVGNPPYWNQDLIDNTFLPFEGA